MLKVHAFAVAGSCLLREEVEAVRCPSHNCQKLWANSSEAALQSGHQISDPATELLFTFSGPGPSWVPEMRFGSHSRKGNMGAYGTRGRKGTILAGHPEVA